jgi:serine/threonine protein kinase
VTPSEYAHERAGLAAVREELPDTEPYRAWSNFTFTATDGRMYEVDLLVIGKSGLHLVELKHWSGKITGDSNTWWRNGRALDNPRILADAKAKRFKSLLQEVARDKAIKVRVPYISTSVLLHAPGATVKLDANGAHGVYGLDGDRSTGLPGVVADLLTSPPGDTRQLIDHSRSKQLAKLLGAAGLRRSVRHRQVGTVLIDENPISEGPTWQDYCGQHTTLDGVIRRVRFYLVQKAASKDERATVQQAAKREFAALEGVQHPGIARTVDFVDHERGPAVIFEHDPDEVRLDRLLEREGNELTIEDRIDIVSTLASTVRYAHGRRLVHRRLSPLSVYVRPIADNRYAVRIRDWQTSGRVSTQGTHVSGTRHLDVLTDVAAAPYLAPDGVTNPNADGVLLDVFSLGTIAYLVFTGSPPARGADDLIQKLMDGGGLDVVADLDGAPDAMVDLVYEATQGDVDLRTTTAAEFARGVDQILEALTRPEEPAERTDPLDATPGDHFGTPDAPHRFEMVEKLGKGSTAEALLVIDRSVDPPRHAVLKVLLDESRRDRLEAEAEVLQSVRDQRIAELLDGPLMVGRRSALLVEDAGRETIDELIRREGRLSIDLLERWGADLLKILDALHLAGINHRDIKPANLAHRELNQKTRQQHLVLFDFSLSRAPLEETKLGTPAYLDPFFHPTRRPRWDAAAERYAAAVTLYEMATGVLPSYGGEANPAVVTDDVTIDLSLFEPDIAEELAHFFATALARDPNERHDSVDAMAREWAAIFAQVPPAEADGPGEELLNLSERDKLADVATVETPLHESGLTPRAVSTLTRVGIATVGDLIARPAYEISRLAGGSEATRREVRRRAKRWRQRLTPPEEQAAEVTGLDVTTPEVTSVDAVLEALVPAETSRNTTKAHSLRLLLGLPKQHGEHTLRWPSQAAVAKELGITAGRVAQIAGAERRKWATVGPIAEVRDQVVELVEQLSGVASAEEVALRLLGLRGSSLSGTERLHSGIGLVRAAVEVELEQGGDARLDIRRVHHKVLLAREPENLDGVPAAKTLDYAVELGKLADELAAADPLPSVTKVNETLSGLKRPDGVEAIGPVRLPRLAVAASRSAALTSRGEIYPVNMEAPRALAEVAGTFSGLRQALTADQLKARVRTRYPQAAPLPDPPELDALVEAAGLPIVPRDGQYAPKTARTFTSLSGTVTHVCTRTGSDLLPAEAHAVEDRLRETLAQRGFLTLTAHRTHLAQARRALAVTFDLAVVNVTAELMTEVRRLANEHRITWSLVLDADRPDAASRDSTNLRRLVVKASQAIDARLAEDSKPLLLVDAEPLGRYGRLSQLETIADPATTRQAARFLLVPALGEGRLPQLDDSPAPTTSGVQHLPSSWVDQVLIKAAGRAS